MKKILSVILLIALCNLTPFTALASSEYDYILDAFEAEFAIAPYAKVIWNTTHEVELELTKEFEGESYTFAICMEDDSYLYYADSYAVAKQMERYVLSTLNVRTGYGVFLMYEESDELQNAEVGVITKEDKDRFYKEYIDLRLDEKVESVKEQHAIELEAVNAEAIARIESARKEAADLIASKEAELVAARAEIAKAEAKYKDELTRALNSANEAVNQKIEELYVEYNTMMNGMTELMSTYEKQIAGLEAEKLELSQRIEELEQKLADALKPAA